MDVKQLDAYLINESDTIYTAYWKYKHNKHKILIVINNNKEFVGVITAKELNRTDYVPSDSVSVIVNKAGKNVQFNENKEKLEEELQKVFSVSENIKCVPVLKGVSVVDLCIREEFEKGKNNAVIKNLEGNYTDGIKSIVNEYLNSNYHLNIKTLDEIITKYMVNHKKVYETTINGIPFYFEDSVISSTVISVSRELNNSVEYNFKDMDFKEGDIVIDIGGNIGMVSIYLAKLFPFLKIYAYEPVKQNYESFLHNIKLNNIPENTIFVENKAVTSDGRPVSMSICRTNSGGGSISDIVTVGAITQEENTNISSVTLNEIFKSHNLKELRLLKIDCEGAEYEILKNTDINILKNIKSLRGEFHENKNLTDKYDIDDLYNYISEYINDLLVYKARDCFVMQ